MKQKQINTFLIRLMFVFFINLVFKIGDQSFNTFSDFTIRGFIFSFSFIAYWICVWYLAVLFHRKIQKKQDLTVNNKKLNTFFLFMFHMVFGLFFSFSANYLYRISDIYFSDNAQIWSIVPVFNPEFTMSLLTIYMMVFTFDSYYHSSIKSKEDQLQLEKLKQENTLAQYLNLKSQIEPHFLFNSLSVLSSIIYTDVNLASDFILRLSRILRYVIEKNEFLLVPLVDELTFVENYLFLIQTRFEKGIIFHNQLDKKLIKSTFVPPSSLQLLIENAVKHNKFSANNPLEITLFNDDNYLIVKNKINLRDDVSDSTKLGLDNLVSRFSHFSDSTVEIKTVDSEFIVSLPILTKKHYEHINI